METLWSMSTTIREAERIVGFLKTAMELEGEVWNQETMVKFQILLIKNRHYLNHSDNKQTFNGLNAEQCKILLNKEQEMTYEQAKGIFDAKNYLDAPMRGRQSMSPLVKLGLVYYTVGEPKKIMITDVGKKLAANEIDFSDFMLEALVKFQYPNPCDEGFKSWNTKPFINTLRLIKLVNEKCEARNEKAKGISTLEFGIFALSLKSYKDVERVADKLLAFRDQLSLHKESEANDFIRNFIKIYLSDFNNPEKNIIEYTDNMIRYLRLTKYIYIRGKYANTYIDLEPRRQTEIEAILASDTGAAKDFTADEWRDFMGHLGTYHFPFETKEKLLEIAHNLISDIVFLETELHLQLSKFNVPDKKEDLLDFIKRQREYRTYLQNLELKQTCLRDSSKIDEVLEALENLRTHNKAKLAKRFSIELEKWSNIALNIIDDAIVIKANSPVGDDNEPIYTAPANVPDIECLYDSFVAICEVTMLTSRDQWYNEGQPVMRHLRDFENKNNNKPAYCLFIAPSLHEDTIDTFFMSVKMYYRGVSQKIIPLSISQFERVLNVVKHCSRSGKPIKHTLVKELYDSCSDVANISDSRKWPEHIEKSLLEWEGRMNGNQNVK